MRSKKISEVIEKDTNTDSKAIKYFVTQAQDYLVEKGTLQPKQPNTAAIADKVSDFNRIKNNMYVELAQTLITPIDTSVKVNKIPTTDIPISSADTKNDLYNKFNKYMSMLKLTQHKIPIAILSTVLGIGTIGGVHYATGSTDALDTIGSDTDTEVLNDTNDTAQRHGVCIATITACTVLLALCTTTAYWIRKKKQQHDTTYTAISMMLSYKYKIEIKYDRQL